DDGGDGVWSTEFGGRSGSGSGTGLVDVDLEFGGVDVSDADAGIGVAAFGHASVVELFEEVLVDLGETVVDVPVEGFRACGNRSTGHRGAGDGWRRRGRHDMDDRDAAGRAAVAGGDDGEGRLVEELLDLDRVARVADLGLRAFANVIDGVERRL